MLPSISRTLAAAVAASIIGPASLTSQTVSTVATTEPIPSVGRIGAVSIDRDGNIIVANFRGSVWRVAPDGRMEVLAQVFQGSSGNAVGPDGTVYQASFLDGRIVRIAPDGAVSTLVPSGLRGPVGLLVEDGGTLLACECRGNAIARVGADGGVAPFAQHPDLDCPNGIARGPDGAYYAVSFNNSHVVRIDADGNARRFATIPEERNAHIAYAGGAFWVTTIAANKLYRVGMDGMATAYVGDGSVGFDDGPVTTATLARPNGIAAAPDGRSVVVNTLKGEWRGDEPTEILLRRIELPDPTDDLERIEIPVGAMVFDALAAGPADGELVVLLHGFPQTGDAFRAQLTALAAAGYRAVAPDQRGYSPRARPADRTEYVMSNFVRDAIGMVRSLGRQRFHLVGHDWGGAVAWAVASSAGDMVQSLTVLSTPHYGALGAARADAGSDQAQRSSYFTDFAKPDAAEWMLADDKAILRQILAGVPAGPRARYLERLGELDALRAALAWYHVFGATTNSGNAGGSPPAPPPPIQVPTLYMWGTEDGAFGEEAALATADFVAGPYTFHRLEGVGHWVPETAAARVNTLLLEHLRRWGGS